MRVSVIIPTFNRVRPLEQTLRSFTELAGDANAEVIVVNDGSTDGTGSFLEQFVAPFDLRVLSQRNAGPSAARNAGVEAATGDLIVFVDDDCIALPGFVAEHLAAHAHGPPRVVIGPMKTPLCHDLSPWTAWEQRRLEEQYTNFAAQPAEVASWRNFYTGNASVRRVDFLATGGFNTTLRRAEDIDLGLRLSQRGLIFHFSERAAVEHRPERSRSAWLANASDYGVVDTQLAFRSGKPFTSWTSSAPFRDRNPLLQVILRVGLSHAANATVIAWLAQRFSRLGERLGRTSVIEAGLSLEYNLAYFQAVRQEIADGRRSPPSVARE